MVAKARYPVVRLASVLCVVLMVLTTFQVMTNTVSVGAHDEVAMVNPSLHDHRRLTISNEGANDPTLTISANGTIHLAWANHVNNGVEIDYKHSWNSGMTFTPDDAISPVFFSISNISIASNGSNIAIAFEGRQTLEANRTVFLLCSADGGIKWSQTYRLCDGSSPSIAFSNGNLYLGINRPNGNSSVFSMVSLMLNENEVTNVTSLMAIDIGDGFGSIIADASAIHYAIYCTYPRSAIIYGYIGQDDGMIDQTTLVTNLYEGYVIDMDLVVNGETILIAWSHGHETGASIQGALSIGDRSSWNVVPISHTLGAFGRMSSTPYGNGFFIAWENTSRAWTEVSVSVMSSDGTIFVDDVGLSTDRVDSSCPSVITTSDGFVSSVWVEAHHQMTELFLSRKLCSTP
jgi:hypothetical protein